jgi:polyhydroxybutyrate depolymerase
MKKLIITLLILPIFAIFTSISAQNTVSGSFTFGGLVREYRLYVPPSYNGSTSFPVIINNHGYGSNNAQQEFYGNFSAIADTANFLVLLPNGTIGPDNQRYFNNFQQPGVGVDDVGFINALLDTIITKYNVDQNRIYSTGMSNGGFMSYDLACQLSHRIAAIASVTGSMVESHLAACQPSHPMPVMEIHGTMDATVPYTGGTAVNFVPIPELMQYWADYNNCNVVLPNLTLPNYSVTDNCTVELQLFPNGDYGSSVEHFKIIGGGHSWPGAVLPIGVTNYDINASVEIWRFFKRFTLSSLTSAPEVQNMQLNAEIYPNPAETYLEIKFATNENQRTIQVFDMLGKLVYSEIKNNDLIAKINVNNWKSGAYFVRVQEGKRVSSQRFVKG